MSEARDGIASSRSYRRVLSFAKMRGWRSGANPAMWRGHLDAILPKPEKMKRRGHHRAMAYGSVPAFMQRLRDASGMDDPASIVNAKS